MLIKRSLSEPTLTEAVTCRWINGFRDHGPMVTTFNYEDQVFFYIEIHGSDLYAKYVKAYCTFDQLTFEAGGGLISSHDTDIYTWGIYFVGFLFGHCSSGIMDIYVDDNYIGSSNIFSVLPETCDCNITQDECIRKGCYWYVDTCQDSPPEPQPQASINYFNSKLINRFDGR